MSVYLHALWTRSDFLTCEFSELGDPDWIYRLDWTGQWMFQLEKPLAATKNTLLHS